jgi:hypothetical protein
VSQATALITRIKVIQNNEKPYQRLSKDEEV